MYIFTLTEDELDLVLAALGLHFEADARANNIKEAEAARKLLVRLDNGASQQERDRIRMPDGSLSASKFIAECDRRDRKVD